MPHPDHIGIPQLRYERPKRKYVSRAIAVGALIGAGWVTHEFVDYNKHIPAATVNPNVVSAEPVEQHDNLHVFVPGLAVDVTFITDAHEAYNHDVNLLKQALS